MPNDSPMVRRESYPSRMRRAKISTISELLFVVLPFIVIAIALAHKGELSTFFYIPEWSIVSAVIMGQSLIRIVGAVLGRRGLEKELILAVLALILVLGLIPVLIILGFVLTSETISGGLAAWQALMFLVSVGVFSWSIHMEAEMEASSIWTD
jgi:hypothetical protein